MDDATTTLRQLRDRMDEFVSSRQWSKYHKPKNLAMSIAIEAAELMEHFQWLEHAEADAVAAQNPHRQEIASEMADVLAYLLSLANALDIDLSSTFQAKMAANDRKYPPESVLGHYDHSLKTRRPSPEQ